MRSRQWGDRKTREKKVKSLRNSPALKERRNKIRATQETLPGQSGDKKQPGGKVSQSEVQYHKREKEGSSARLIGKRLERQPK